MKKLILFSFSFLAISLSFGQEVEPCAMDAIEDKYRSMYPNYDQLRHEEMMRLANTPRSESKDVSALKKIPCVFHILHENGVGNISDEQVQDALDLLNLDYNRQNADAGSTRNTATAPFEPEAASMEMEFVLAKIDPNGQCTNGILRKDVPNHVTFEVDKNSEPHKHASLGGSDAWPRNEYFNIWVVNSIDDGGQPGIILGYAQFPQWGAADEYGVVIRHDYTGSIGTATGGDGRTLTHELGHCFSLAHIFQSGCGNNGSNCNSQGDYCCDTPPQNEADYTCSQTLNTCSQVPPADAYGFDALDQIENYMSYNSCQNMFSYDQVTVMENSFTSYSWLANLHSPANLVATGVNLPDAICRAEFSADNLVLCPGGQVQFTDETYNYANDWDWTFTGGTPSTSTDQNPLITYDTPGLYPVTLIGSDGANSDTETKTSYIRVLPAGSSIPFLESFENLSTLNNIEEWYYTNADNNSTWGITSTAGHTGTKSAKLSNYGQDAGSSDELISAPVDLSSVTAATGMTMSFRYAYSKRSAGDSETLKLKVTKDCGGAWSTRKTLVGDFLGTNVSASSWTPSSINDWVTVHITNITSSYWVDDFAYKFEFVSDYGNNIFIDDINIYAGPQSDDIVTAGAGLNDELLLENLTVFPNPTENELNVRFLLGNAQEMNFVIQDVSGKMVQSSSVHAAEGTNLVMLDSSKLASGMYFLNISSDNRKQTIQFVVK